jgi:hypothetical protein
MKGVHNTCAEIDPGIMRRCMIAVIALAGGMALGVDFVEAAPIAGVTATASSEEAPNRLAANTVNKHGFDRDTLPPLEHDRRFAVLRLLQPDPRRRSTVWRRQEPVVMPCRQTGKQLDNRFGKARNGGEYDMM